MTRRLRLRPLLYPAGLLVAFVLYVLVQTGVSPWAAGRPMLVAVGLGLALPWLFGLLTGDRDRAGVLAVIVALLVLGGQSRIVALVLVAVFAVLLAEYWHSRHRPTSVWWGAVSRAAAFAAVVALVTVGVAALQGSRLARMANDVIGESALAHLTGGTIAEPADLPSVYLLLLDSYPRADKLKGVLGIDNRSFVKDLQSRGFTVAGRSRSNHVTTDLTLAAMLNGSAPVGLDSGSAQYRPFVNEGTVLRLFRDLGYEVVSFSSGFEGMSLRRADRFVDSGQLNEFEFELLQSSGVVGALDAIAPTLLADQHRARIQATFKGLEQLAAEPSARPRFALAHVVSPHSPQVFDGDGRPIEIRGMRMLVFDEGVEYTLLGHDEYVRRLQGQLVHLNEEAIQAIDAIVEGDPRAVVVVFSDHGTGIKRLAGPPGSDVDLRTANLLAVRSPGATGIIDDRSTLVNVLPRILRAYTGSGPADVPETIYGQDPDGNPTVFERPD